MRLSPDEQQVLDADYDKGEVRRTEVARYRLIHRGSARLVRDLYRTEGEYRAYIMAGVKLKLPGQR